MHFEPLEIMQRAEALRDGASFTAYPDVIVAKVQGKLCVMHGGTTVHAGSPPVAAVLARTLYRTSQN